MWNNSIHRFHVFVGVLDKYALRKFKSTAETLRLKPVSFSFDKISDTFFSYSFAIFIALSFVLFWMIFINITS